ncbi:Uma2 family endonuclease [Phormidesmis priestleyi]
MVIASTAAISSLEVTSSADGCVDLPEGMEEVDGQLVEKTGMTLKHGLAQINLAAEWRSYDAANGRNGKVYTEVVCQTGKQKRRPDVAYLTGDLIEQYGQPAIFPQSFPLVAEVASPDDSAEDLFIKAREYLNSGSQEVWLLFPENLLVMVVTPQTWLMFLEADTVGTQSVLQGFSISVAVLFS